MVYLSKKWLILAFILGIGGISFIKPAEQSYSGSSKSLTKEKQKEVQKRFFYHLLWNSDINWNHGFNVHGIRSFIENEGMSPNATPQVENFSGRGGWRYERESTKLPLIFWVLALTRQVSAEDKLPMLRYLLSKGANVNFVLPHRNDLPPDVVRGVEQGDTLLHLAARLNSADIFKELLAACVDPEIKNSEGQTAWDIATQMGNGDILALRPRAGVIAQACTLARSAGSALGAIWGAASSGFIG